MSRSDDPLFGPDESGIDSKEFSSSFSFASAEPEQVREVLLPGAMRGEKPSIPNFSFHQAMSDFTDVVSAESLPVEQKFKSLLELGCRHLNLQTALLSRTSDDSCEVSEIFSVTSNNLPVKKGSKLSTADRAYRRTVLQAEPYIIQNARNFAAPEQWLRYETYIGSAVEVSGQPAGTVCFVSDEQRAQPFHDSERLFVKIIARYLGNELGRAEVRQALTYRVEFEHLLNSISTRFINLEPEHVDQGIKDALAEIAAFARADLSYVFLFKDKAESMDITHYWFAEGTEHPVSAFDIPVERYSWITEKILCREAVYFGALDELPSEAEAIEVFCRKQGIGSAIMVPMVHSGAPIGLVGFASRKARQHFDEHTIRLLEMVGCMLAGAVEYKRAQAALRLLEVEVRHAQKLESLGVLAGGIAHDFNNMLMGILGNAGIALNQLPLKSPARISLRRIEQISHKAAELTEQLLAYSGKGKFFVEVLNLSQVVEEMGELLEAAISKKHTLRCNFPHDLPAIEGDPAQISQVIMNLVANASEAIGDRQGAITLSTGLVAADREFLFDAYLFGDAPDGVYTYLRVADTGCGMDEEEVSRIFDPFYTTKCTGRGLGLAGVLGIVRAHGGAIKVRSSLGEGTVFTVLFPCSERQELILVSEPPPQLEQAPANGLVLVIDDEESVRSVLAQLLKQVGFDVLTAADGQAGLSLYQLNADAIDVVILDMSLPDIDGGEVYRRIAPLPGDSKIILSSGYSEQEFSRHFAGERFGGFLQKPYRPEVLLRKVFDAVQEEEQEQK